MKKLTKLLTITLIAIIGVAGYLALSHEAKAAEPAKFETSDFNITPREVFPGQLVTISVNVKNVGESEGLENLEYTITSPQTGNLVTMFWWVVDLAPGENETYSYQIAKQETGTYTVDGPGVSHDFVVVGREEKSKELAREFILENSSTYKYDGYDLKYLETLYPDVAEHPYLWTFVYEFKSEHSGYGDRTGENLLQVITLHEAHITVDNGKVVTAILDLKWNMIEQKMLEEELVE